MGHEYEMADYNRGDLIFTKEMLLAEPIEKVPLRNEGGRASPTPRRRVGPWKASALATRVRVWSVW